MGIELVDIIKIGVDIVILVVLPITGMLAIRVLTDVDKNQKDIADSLIKLWEAHSNLSKEFYTLQGEHYAHHERRHQKEGGG